MSKAFIDTNVLLYAQDPRDPARQRISRVLIERLQREASGVISTQVLQEFYVIATTRFRQDPLVARGLVQALGVFEVVLITPGLIENAISISVLNQISFWDALIVSTAEAAHCEILLTEDLNHGQTIHTVRIENPFR
jgi:predicted nucleic acid-binding protein